MSKQNRDGLVKVFNALGSTLNFSKKIAKKSLKPIVMLAPPAIIGYASNSLSLGAMFFLVCEIGIRQPDIYMAFEDVIYNYNRAYTKSSKLSQLKKDITDFKINYRRYRDCPDSGLSTLLFAVFRAPAIILAIMHAATITIDMCDKSTTYRENIPFLNTLTKTNTNIEINNSELPKRQNTKYLVAKA